MKFHHLPKDLTTGTWVTDGSYYRAEKLAAWAVVNNDLKLVGSSPISGRITSQSAECKGLLAGRVMGPLKNIHADPKPIIETINAAISEQMRDFQWIKVNNRSIIRNIAFMSAPDSIFEWVKGHQKGAVDMLGKCNIAADYHAKRAAKSGKLPVLQESWEFSDTYFFTHKGNLFEGDVRRRILKSVTKINSLVFCENIKNARFQHDKWWMERPSKTALCKYAHIRFKLFTRSLPTFARLAKRFAHLYASKQCPSCNSGLESDIHVFAECSAYLGVKLELWEEIEDYLRRRTKVRMATFRDNVRDWINIPLTDGVERKWWFLGGIPLEVEEWLQDIMQKKERVEIWQDIHAMIMKTVQDIWSSRCTVNKHKRGLLKDLMDDAYEEHMLATGVEVLVEEEFEIEADWILSPM